MKTNTLSITNTSLFYFVGILSIIFTSCGSYQNSSYYDSDGIYGSRSNRAVLNDSQERQYNNDKYKDYFGSLQNDNQTEEIFTNVDNYNSYNVDVQDQRNDNAGYPGWGSNPQGISINIYDNNWGMNNWGYNGGFGWNMNNWGYNNGFGWGMNNWGWNGGFGWNNWYGNNWGPTVGFGWNSWYGNNWGYNNYRSDRSYARNEGRRGSSSFTDSNGNARNSGTFNRAENTTISRRAVNSNSSRDTNFNRNSFDRSARTTPTFSRTQSQTRYDSQNAPRRGNTNNGRIERNTQSRPQSNTNNSRNYTPSRNDNSSRNYTPSSTGRSSSGNNSSGGGRSSSGGSSRGGRG